MENEMVTLFDLGVHGISHRFCLCLGCFSFNATLATPRVSSCQTSKLNPKSGPVHMPPIYNIPLFHQSKEYHSHIPLYKHSFHFISIVSSISFSIIGVISLKSKPYIILHSPV